jgi:hypothetical protein
MEAARRQPGVLSTAALVRADEPVGPTHPLEVGATGSLAPEQGLELELGAGNVDAFDWFALVHGAHCAPRRAN